MADAILSARFAFVCAMPMELRPLVRRLGLSKLHRGGAVFRTGELSGSPVVGTVIGIGTERARLGTQRILDAIDVQHVVVVGITGAVENSTPIGALVQPEVVIDGATGIERRPVNLGEETPHGKMWTSDELHTDLDVIAELRAQGVVALDMETAAVAEVCELAGVPWSVVRAISDRATDGSVNPEVLELSDPDGTPNGRAVARYLLRHPGHLPRLFRLAKGARLAAKVAADAAVVACSRA